MDKCPHCFQEVFNHESTKYCMYCGKELKINTCKNDSCVICKEQIILPDYARFCPACKGNSTMNVELPY